MRGGSLRPKKRVSSLYGSSEFFDAATTADGSTVRSVRVAGHTDMS